MSESWSDSEFESASDEQNVLDSDDEELLYVRERVIDWVRREGEEKGKGKGKRKRKGKEEAGCLLVPDSVFLDGEHDASEQEVQVVPQSASDDAP